MKKIWNLSASLLCGMLTAMSCVSCVAVATEDEDSNTETPATEEAELSSTWADRSTMKCMVEFAKLAYKPGITPNCSYSPASSIPSTDVTKIWASTGSGAEDIIVIGFAGTHPTDLGDILQDVKSQTTTTPRNPLDDSLPSVGAVGLGWSARWTTQANLTGMAGFFAKQITSHKTSGRRMHVYVTGHSLGAVTATLAAYDIAQYFKAHSTGVSYAVDAITFDSPRLGHADARDNYRKALLESVCPGKDGQMCLRLKQLTRDQDPVQSLPLGEFHAVWSPTAGDRSVGPDGPYAGKLLPYCSQLNVPKLLVLGGLANHLLPAWSAQIDTAPDSQIFCN